jgi:hypothetical protein
MEQLRNVQKYEKRLIEKQGKPIGILTTKDTKDTKK